MSRRGVLVRITSRYRCSSLSYAEIIQSIGIASKSSAACASAPTQPTEFQPGCSRVVIISGPGVAGDEAGSVACAETSVVVVRGSSSLGSTTHPG